MYVWIWRRLPGGRPGKVAGSVLLFAGVLALLLFVVFPWAEPRLPFNNVNVDQPANVTVVAVPAAVGLRTRSIRRVDSPKETARTAWSTTTTGRG